MKKIIKAWCKEYRELSNLSKACDLKVLDATQIDWSWGFLCHHYQYRLCVEGTEDNIKLFENGLE